MTRAFPIAPCTNGQNGKRRLSNDIRILHPLLAPFAGIWCHRGACGGSMGATLRSQDGRDASKGLEMPENKPRPRRGWPPRAPRWGRPLIFGLVIALVIGLAYFRALGPLEDRLLTPVLPFLVIGLGLTSIFWGAMKVNEQDRQEMQDNVFTHLRLLAKLPVPALRAFFVIAGIAIVALGLAALLD